MSRMITITGARGGQGTSTAAATLALFAAGQGPTTLVVADRPATATLLGLPRPADDDLQEVTSTLALAAIGTDSHTDVTIIDGGLHATSHGEATIGERYVVLRGPCGRVRP